jgi:MFS family permease
MTRDHRHPPTAETRHRLPLAAPALGLPNGARAFGHRNYRLFFGGQLVSLIGTWMQTVAQSWLVLQLTGDPFMLGVVAAAQFLPVMILGLFGGLIADALPKRRTLLGTQLVKMVLSFTMFGLVATGTVEVWQVVALAALGGLTNVFDMPTRQAFSVEMVGREDVANAVALNSAMFNGARIVGPAVAGLVIGAFDISTAFLIDAVSFLAVIAALLAMRDSELRMPPPMVRPGSVAEVVAGVREGLRYVRATPLVLLAVAGVGLVATFGMNFPVIIPALAQDVLRSDASGYGFLMAASGVGSLTAALTIAFSRRARPSLIVIGGVVVGAGEIVLGLSGSFPISLVLMFLIGFGAISMAATANTTIQLIVPDHLRGRTMSVYVTVFAGSTPVGGLLMGGIASDFGVAASLAAGGVACALIGLVGIAWLRSAGGRAALAAELGEGEPAQPPVPPPEPASGSGRAGSGADEETGLPTAAGPLAPDRAAGQMAADRGPTVSSGRAGR